MADSFVAAMDPAHFAAESAHQAADLIGEARGRRGLISLGMQDLNVASSGADSTQRWSQSQQPLRRLGIAADAA